MPIIHNRKLMPDNCGSVKIFHHYIIINTITFYAHNKAYNLHVHSIEI